VTATAARAASTSVRVTRIKRRGRYITLTIRREPATGQVVVTAYKSGRHGVRLHLTRHSRDNATLVFAAELPAGHWSVIVVCDRAAGDGPVTLEPRAVNIPR